MTTGEAFVHTLQKVIVISHTRLHEAHRSCPICHAGPFTTMEQIVDHFEEHPERLESRCYEKEGEWIVLCGPSDYYKQHPNEVPQSIANLAQIREQEQRLGLEPPVGHDMIEYTGLRSQRVQK